MPLQAEKDVQKIIGMMEEAGSELARKKEASHQVKALKAEVHSHEAEAQQLTAEHQHLQRQLASLNDRLHRLEHQVTPRAPLLKEPASCLSEPIGMIRYMFIRLHNYMLRDPRTLL